MSKNYKILSGLLVLGLILVGGYFGYYLPELDKSSINKNLLLVQDFTKKHVELANDLNEQFNASNIVNIDTDKFQKDLDTIQTLSKDVETNYLNKLDGGFNPKTQSFSKVSRDELNDQFKILSSYKEYIKYYDCVIKKINQQNTNWIEVALSIKKINQDNPTDEVSLKAFEEVTNLIDNGLPLFDQINSCFEGSFVQYKTEDLTKAIIDTRNTFEKMSNGYKIILAGIKENNTAKFDEGLNSLNGINIEEIPLIAKKELLFLKPAESFGNPESILNSRISVYEDKYNQALK